MNGSTHRNRLATETSAYLLQHAGNPVDWYPWGNEALTLARELDRPILLSVGYSACHWCHVMERECFENEDIAALMNEHFVCIKVDREERPDVDHLYMKALQGMTGRGGWPMTVFLTPDARPFFAGTYFPPEDRSGMPGFPRVLLGVAQTWTEKRGDVDASAERMVDYLGATRSRAAGAELDEAAVLEAAGTLAGMIDEEHGGFGRAPKFPGSMALSLLMQAELRRPDDHTRRLVALSLDRMAAGGIRDHLGGGFHRYSVDRVWLVPHFEKMLYDQALLAWLYAEASRRFAEPRYLGIAVEICDYVVREMTSPEGGFYSAQDADSEGEEGRFFVWTRDEILDVLGREAGERFCEAYGVREGGNFEGATILHRSGEPGIAAVEDALAQGRRLLLERRGQRAAPETDRKIVADWNGLMISAMAGVGRLAGRSDFVATAERAAAFVRSAMTGATGLQHMYAGGSARVAAFLDDHAFFGRACLDLFAIRPCEEHLRSARLCAERLLGDFADSTRGGFFFTGSRGESLVARTCELSDAAVPSGNSVAAELLLRLWSLTGDDQYRRPGEAVLQRFAGEALHYPYGAPYLLAVALQNRRGLRTAVAVGAAALREGLSRVALRVYDPGCTVIELDGEEEPWWPSALKSKTAASGTAAVYLCQGSSCSLPISDESALAAALAASGPMEEEERG